MEIDKFVRVKITDEPTKFVRITMKERLTGNDEKYCFLYSSINAGFDSDTNTSSVRKGRGMKTQLKFLKEAVILAHQNPMLEIHIASSDERCEDKSWTRQHITKVEKTLYYCYEEDILLSVDDVVDHFEYLGEEITDEQALEKMKEVILIYTNA